MFTINELATGATVPPHVARYCMRIGLLQSSGKKENGCRLFSHQYARRLRFIRLAKNLGFTLSEMREITDHAAHAYHGDSPCNDVRRIIQERIHENRAKIDEMLSLQTHREKAPEQWELMPDGIPDGHHVCHLIETFEDEIDESIKISTTAEQG